MGIFTSTPLLHCLLYFLSLSPIYAKKRLKNEWNTFSYLTKMRKLYSYTRHINGIAAMLEEEEAASIAEDPDVISIFLSERIKPQTTYSWKFLGLDANEVFSNGSSALKKASFGKDTIIANIDTGVWPESKSFSGEHLGPIPSRWRGICQQSTDGIKVPCNRKLIGLRFFDKGFIAAGNSHNGTSDTNARDIIGHGTHTLSTAGGSPVHGANFFGYGYGVALGGAPDARVAAYKACWSTGCYNIDVLAAFDYAIADGVDVLSVSLGVKSRDYFKDVNAIGAFHAVRNNITVVASAGNRGPLPFSVLNVAPWILTVGATTTDRQFKSHVAIANNNKCFKNVQLKGISLSTERLPFNKYLSLITGRAAKAANARDSDAMMCLNGTPSTKMTAGKIVVCVVGGTPSAEKGHTAAVAGAAAMILVTEKPCSSQIQAEPYTLPACALSYPDGETLLAYINSTKNPMAYIGSVKTEFGTRPAPVMLYFSARGPNNITLGILKPDITAPGLNILAAYTEVNSPADEDWDKRRSNFTLMSGTSMSCPHISGIVALIKTLHPNWSPAAIKSAIMTTATTLDKNGGPILDHNSRLWATPFDYGAGQVQPNCAMDPGLVYDLTANDYLNFLCAQGYNQTIMEKFSKGRYHCPKNFSLRDFNYPSIMVPDLKGSATITRTLKNVGSPNTYSVCCREPIRISLSVVSDNLKFERMGETKSFKLILKVTKKFNKKNEFMFGELTWYDGQHHVKSQIVVKAI